MEVDWDRPLGPAEAAVARELRAHRGPQPEALVSIRLGLPRRTVRYHANRLVALGVVDLVEAGPWGSTYRWRSDAPPSPYDTVGPVGECPRCQAIVDYDERSAPGGRVLEG